MHGLAAATTRQAHERAQPVAIPEADGVDGAADGASAAGGSLTTLRWQRYVGWLAILALCGLMVGRRFFRRAKAKAGSAGALRGPPKREV